MNHHEVSINGPPKPTMKHFSHPHILNLVTKPQHHQNDINMILCSGCNLSAATSPSGSPWVYSCAPCGFFLHVSCSRMPPEITHPCCGQHRGSHVLRLHPRPDAARHPSGAFKCAACLKDDDCFAYHCRPCGLDLHPACAVAPLSLSLPANGPHRHRHPHPLRLEFSPPYPHQTFSCAACRRVGVKGWLYRCDACAFDVHFACARPAPRPPPPPPAPQPRTAAAPPSQHDVNQRYVRYVMQNHPHMAGMLLRPPNGGGGNNYLRPQGNNVGANMMNQQQQALMRFFMANSNNGNANNPQNLAAQMMMQSVTAGGANTNGFDPMASGVDPTGGAAAGGFDPAAMSGFNFDFGAMSGGGVDSGAMSRGGVDFGAMSGGGVDFGAMMSGGFDFSVLGGLG